MLLTKRPKNMVEYLRRTGYEKLPNIWCGVSVENQEVANVRIPILLLLKTPVRFVSCEPLLSPIYFKIGDVQTLSGDGINDIYNKPHKIDWVIVGGESGNGVRPMHPDWVNEIVHQCAVHKTPLFFKSWGAYASVNDLLPLASDYLANHKSFGLKYDGTKTNYISVNESLQIAWMIPDPAKLAGNIVEGKEYNEFPKI
jgi:protein gp37